MLQAPKNRRSHPVIDPVIGPWCPSHFQGLLPHEPWNTTKAGRTGELQLWLVVKNHWEGLFFISMCCKGVFARSCTVAWMLLCTEEGSAVVIWLDHIFLNKIIRNQVLELSGKLLSRRHFESSLDKICYRLCNGPV